MAAHAVRLTADLQRSRERLVTAREEERRRLRRDLHDGLGPTLARMLLQLEPPATCSPATPAPTAAHRVGAARAAVGDIRRLVYELRPPALDDLGLVGALARQAERIRAARRRASRPRAAPPLPAAVEVAAYRIAAEALTNVARHRRRAHCRVVRGARRAGARGQRRRPGHARAATAPGSG